MAEDDLKEIEDALARLPLRSVSTTLDQRVLRLCRGKRSRWLVAAAAAALISAAGAALWLAAAENRRHPSAQALPAMEPQNPVVSIEPLRAARTLSGVEDEGIVAIIDGAPLHRVRRRWVHEVWIMDDQGTRMSLAIPREEILLIRVEPF